MLATEESTTYRVDNETYKRGDVFLADLSLVIGAEQGGSNKPVLLLQNDIGNRFSPTVIVCVITSKVKKQMPTHVYLSAENNNLDRESYALLEQIKTIDKRRLIKKVTKINDVDMELVDNALKISMGLTN
ncbi:PemK family transcriptional regulator [Mycobacterium sp. E3298]|nr:type II toxin-antitoxin system PemK/MazF family toxin [Mycobacterium sp. E3298]OBG93869.1 PemK family transcriptional regulator [Mycobacterium sp. E3298]